MPQALSMFFLRQREPIIVAGTHGKTTTTSLLAWVLEAAGEDPGLLVGGWAKNFDGNHKLGTGRWFVVEGDEYDTAFFDKGPKFLHYRPRYAILTGVEFDHGDIYPTLEAVKSAFSRFIRLVPPQGFLMAGSEGGSVAEIIREAACPVETYGIGPGVDWEARSIDFAGELTRFEAVRRGRLLGRFDLPLMGLHNVKNALSVVALASHLGLSPEKIRAGLKSFAGVRRRQEVVGVENGVLVIDDFAHHPTAIAETIAAVKGRYPGRRLWAIFEPRSATSRRNVFQEAFVEALTGADRPVMVDLFSPEKVAAEVRLNPRKVVEGLVARGKEALFFSNADAVVEGISPILSSGDVILVMSSGGFDGIHRKLLRAIAKV
jgi:UDP-N-acetylmuramate: L-alanyl-gamma-D-glutamyl-meso-diaminopimelate ligase